MSGRLRRWVNAYLVAWTVGAVGAAGSHLLRNEEEAAASHWAASPGWQREIGLFNLAIAFILVQVLPRAEDVPRRMMLRTGVFLSVLLGANHVAALAAGGPGEQRIHWTAVALNLANGTASGVILAADRRQRLAVG
jgi:hypothetical protein